MGILKIENRRSRAAQCRFHCTAKENILGIAQPACPLHQIIPPRKRKAHRINLACYQAHLYLATVKAHFCRAEPQQRVEYQVQLQVLPVAAPHRIRVTVTNPLALTSTSTWICWITIVHRLPSRFKARFPLAVLHQEPPGRLIHPPWDQDSLCLCLDHSPFLYQEHQDQAQAQEEYQCPGTIAFHRRILVHIICPMGMATVVLTSTSWDTVMHMPMLSLVLVLLRGGLVMMVVVIPRKFQVKSISKARVLVLVRSYK